MEIAAEVWTFWYEIEFGRLTDWSGAYEVHNVLNPSFVRFTTHINKMWECENEWLRYQFSRGHKTRRSSPKERIRPPSCMVMHK